MIIPVLIAAVVGYLLGSLPFGYLVARAKGVNIFEVGSKNPGATNVRRVLGHGAGNIVLVLDAAKGSVAAFAPYAWRLVFARGATQFGPQEFSYFALAGVIGAILGHSYSCFTGFRGGKGVATGAGGFLVLFPAGALIALGVFAVAVALTRYASLSSMLAAMSLPFSAYFLHGSPFLAGVTVVIAVFIIYRHRSNISRLLAGTETKLGQKKPDANSQKP